LISALIQAEKDCQAHGGGLKLCRVGGQPLTILEMTKLIFHFDHHKDAERAVAEFLAKPTQAEAKRTP